MAASPRDRRSLLAAALLRSIGTAIVGVALAVYLAEIGLDAGGIGLVSSAGLAGAAAAAALVAVAGDRWGRRRTLVALALTAASAGGLFLAAESLPALAALAFLGRINAMGRDRGATGARRRCSSRRRCPRPCRPNGAPGPSPGTRRSRTAAMRWAA